MKICPTSGIRVAITNYATQLYRWEKTAEYFSRRVDWWNEFGTFRGFLVVETFQGNVMQACFAASKEAAIETLKKISEQRSGGFPHPMSAFYDVTIPPNNDGTVFFQIQFGGRYSGKKPAAVRQINLS